MRLGQAEIHEDTTEMEAYLSSLAKDEGILDEIFKQTKYQKQIQQAILGSGEQKTPKDAVIR